MNVNATFDIEPHSTELEQQILGALLSNNDLLARIGGITTPEHFHDPTHEDIFRNICARIGRDHIATATTVASDMAQHEGLKGLGGGKYLARLVGASISSFAIADYASDLEALWRRRTLLGALREAQEAVLGQSDPDVAVAGLEAVLMGLPERDGQESSVSALKAMTQTVMSINRAYSGEQVSVPTGIVAIDKRHGGFWKQNLVIVAGRPSMGKSALALEFAIRAADAGRFVGFVSLEMSNTELMERIIGAKTRIDYEKLRRGAIEEADMRKVVEVAKQAQDMPMFIVPPHVRDIAAIHSALKQIKKRQGRLDLVVVDYLQLIRARGNNANERVSEVTQGLKALAKLLDVPVIALSQLSRAVEGRDNKRPVLSDLRDSGSIEQDADVVMFCYREEYYLAREQPPEKDGARADYEAALAASRNKMEIITAKQRMGSIGTDRVGCHMPTNRFWDFEEQETMF